jgi:hypothetical protein
MDSYFSQTRNVELSILEHLTTQINANWNNINIVKTFSQITQKSAPVVCVRMFDNNPFRREVGSDELENRYGIIIDVFATSDGQRIDLTDSIIGYLKSGCVYYSFSQQSGNPETLDKTADGRIQIVKFTRNSKLDFGDNVTSIDRFRHIISFIARKSS